MGCICCVEGLNESVTNQDINGLSMESNGTWKAKERMIIKVNNFRWPYVLQGEEEYTIYHYNDGTRTNKNGKPILTIDDKLEGNSLMHIKNLKEEILGILEVKSDRLHHTKFHLKNSGNITIAIVNRDYSADPIKFYVKSADGERTYYSINGTFCGHKFVIRNSRGQIVGKSSRQLTNSEDGSYGVEICKGFDFVLMALIMAVIDKYPNIPLIPAHYHANRWCMMAFYGEMECILYKIRFILCKMLS